MAFFKTASKLVTTATTATTTLAPTVVAKRTAATVCCLKVKRPAMTATVSTRTPV
jgi:hypothetical protein